MGRGTRTSCAAARSAVLATLLLLARGSVPAGDAGGPPATDGVVLEESWEIQVVSEGAARLRYRNRTKVLTTRGVERFNSAAASYNPWIRVESLRGAVVLPDGKRLTVKRNEITDAAAYASYELYSDSRVRILNFPSVVPGAIVEYEYEVAMDSLLYLPRVIQLQDDLNAESRTLLVRRPASFPLTLVERGGGLTREDETQAGELLSRWTVRDQRPLPFEPAAPPIEDVAPRVEIYPGRVAFEEHRVDTTTWDGIAAWYRGLAASRTQATQDVAAQARALVDGATDPAEKIRRVYEFLQQKVRYVAVELGIGGWQPHASDHVLRMQYGDCKDKATLMISMLRSVGLDGLPALVRTRDAGRLDPARPTLGFNHVIVAIPHADGFEFIDPTSEYTPSGDLPWTDQGVLALVVHDDGRGVAVETPVFPPEHNLERRVIEARIDALGALEGTLRLEANGQRRAALAAFLKEAAARDREAVLARHLASLCPGATLIGHDVLPDENGALRLLLRFRIQRFVTRAGGLDLVSPHLASLADIAGFGDLASREQPILSRFLWSLSSEVDLRLPAGITPKRLPEDVVQEAAGLRVSASYKLVSDEQGTSLDVRRTASMSRREIAIEEIPALRGVVESLRRTEAGAITLQPAPSSGS